MELYKTRGFGEYFQDTFSFLKINGKHFFKNYLIVNGIFLLILSVLIYFFVTFLSDFFFSGAMNNGNNSEFERFINENSGMFAILFFLFLIIGIIAGIVSYSFPPIYLNLYANRGDNNFNTADIVNAYKTNIGKLLVFTVCSIIMFIPLIIVFAIGCMALMITLIGILAIPILIGAFMLFYAMALMEYLENKKSIWDSFGYSWKLLKSNFWAAITSVGLFYLISSIVQNIVAFIPYIFGMLSIFTNIESGNVNPQETAYTMVMLMLVVFFISIFLGAFLNSIVQLNQGVVFYSLKEENENTNSKSLIDQIGSGE